MKSLKKCLIATLTVLLLLCVAVYAVACNRTYVLALDANGGTLSQQRIELKEGEDVYDAVKDLAPTRDGLTFGGWFVGDTELTSGVKMTEGLTLTAKWKVDYTVEQYLQNLDGSGYTRSATTITASDYLGSKVAPQAPKAEGFHTVDNANAVKEATLDEKTANVLRFYYDRNEYSLIYDANLPASVDYTDMEEGKGLYEAQVEVAEQAFDAPRQYRFVGWSTEPNGNVEYTAGKKVQLKGDTTLYALWKVGYVDAWGGSDLIFLNDDGSALTLERLDETYTGTVDANGNFTVEGMTGKLLDGKFAYYRADFAATFSWLDGYYHAPEEQAELIDSTVTLKLDGYLSGTYKDSEGEVNGTYGYDPQAKSYYFETVGERHNFKLGTYKGTQVFAFAGDEAGVYDQLVSISAMGGYDGDYTLYLDGYGSAIVGDTSGSATQPQLYEGVYSLEYSDYAYGSQPVYLIHVYTEQGEFEFFNYPPIPDGVVLKDEYAGTYSGKLEGADVTLTLDGYSLLNGAKLGDDEYNYYVTESAIFGTLLNLFDDDYNEVMTLRFDADKKTFEQFDTSYVEYMYLNGANLYYPIVLLYDSTSEKGKRAEIYTSDEDDNLVLAATCDYEALGELYGYTYYRLTLKANTTCTGNPFPVGEETDFESVSLVFNPDDLIASVYYVLEYNGDPLYETYTQKEGTATIWQGLDTGVSGLGSFFIDGNSVTEGSLDAIDSANATNVLGRMGNTPKTFTYQGEKGMEKKYLLLNEDGTFRELQFEPYQAMLVDEYGTAKDLAGVYFDGLGNAYYYAKNDLTTPDAAGAVSKTEETTLDGTAIWTIEPEDGQPVKFVIYESAQGNLNVYPYYEEKVELTKGEEKLVLDGYNYRARYTDADGNEFAGEYHIVDPSDSKVPTGYKTTYVMQVEGSLLWRFYVKEDGAFDAVLSIFGNMDEAFLVVMDDSYNSIGMFMASLEGIEPSLMYMLMSDENTIGMGGAFTVHKVSDERVEVALELMMMNEPEEKVWTETLILGDFAEDGTCTIYNKTVDNVYTDGMAKLTLDGYGYADYVDEYGYVTTGAYVVFDDTHVAYETSDGGRQIVLKPDNEHKTFEELDLSAYYGEYKAEDGSTITLGDYFLVDGENTGFWYVEGTTGVIMVYGDEGVYETTNFTPGANTITYGGKEYTLVTE